MLWMADLTYKKAKNISINHILFKLNYIFHPWVLFKKNINLYYKSHIANNQVIKLMKEIQFCYKNLIYMQKLQKRAHYYSL